MEKRVCSYSLNEIKRSLTGINELRISASALQAARNIGFSRQQIVDAVQQLKKGDFVKSMTTYNDHKVWQDVYNTTYNGFDLYIKFQKDEFGHFVISFKEK